MSCCVSVLQIVQCGVGCCAGLILCRYWLRNDDLFVRSWANIRLVFLFRVCSDVFIGGGTSLIMILGSCWFSYSSVNSVWIVLQCDFIVSGVLSCGRVDLVC